MFSQDQYQGKICLSTVIDCIAAEATAVIKYTWWAASYPPSPNEAPPHQRALLNPRRCSSLWIGASIFHSALHTAWSVGASPLEWVLINPLLDLNYKCLYFIPDSFLPPLSARLSLDWLLCWIGAPWPGLAPLNFIPRSFITIITPLPHPAPHIRHSSIAGGTPLFPPNSSYFLSNSILIHHELTSQFQSFWYDILSQTT